MVRPGARVVGLNVADRLAVELHQEAIDSRLVDMVLDVPKASAGEVYHRATCGSRSHLARIGKSERDSATNSNPEEAVPAVMGQAADNVSTVTLRLVKTQISAAMSSDRRTIASASSGPSISARAAASA
jgi:hypothetical protein